MSRVRSRRVAALLDPIPRRLHTAIDFVPTPGTVEAELLGFDLPARTLFANFQGMAIRAVYSTAADGNSKIGRLKLGSTILISRSAGDNDKIVELYCRLWRFTATTFQGFARAVATDVAPTTTTPVGAITWADLQRIAITGETPTAAGGMNAQQLDVTMIP